MQFAASPVYIALLDHIVLVGGNDLSAYGDPATGRNFFHVLALSAAEDDTASMGFGSDSARPDLRAVLDHWVSTAFAVPCLELLSRIAFSGLKLMAAA